MKNELNIDIMNKTNFIFIGEAGSGKSEIAINFAKYLLEHGDKPVHFFDMDMTKPLFRSRDLQNEIMKMGIQFHYQEQFFDAPTLVGGANPLLKNENSYVVMDVGGNDIGARAIGGFAPKINRENTDVFYVLNSYRPWSGQLRHIDETLSSILYISHIRPDKIRLISNPNLGTMTTPDEVVAGYEITKELIDPVMKIDFLCARSEISEEVQAKITTPVFPIQLYLSYEWS